MENYTIELIMPFTERERCWSLISTPYMWTKKEKKHAHFSTCGYLYLSINISNSRYVKVVIFLCMLKNAKVLNLCVNWKPPKSCKWNLLRGQCALSRLVCWINCEERIDFYGVSVAWSKVRSSNSISVQVIEFISVWFNKNKSTHFNYTPTYRLLPCKSNSKCRFCNKFLVVWVCIWNEWNPLSSGLLYE